MSKRLVLLAAASPLALVIAVPAVAQVDDGYAQVEEVIETYSEPVVQDIGEWESDEWEAGAAYSHGDYEDPAEEYWDSDYQGRPLRRTIERRSHGGMDHGGMHHAYMGGGHHAMAPGQPRQLAYSAEERAEWLAQCRALRAEPELVYYEDERDENGALVGGVLGAVVGGVVGHEVRNRHRLAGTLIGAGVGGLAGAVIGSLIDGDDDDERRVIAAPQEPGFDYCEAYLINYERGYGVPQHVAYAPVMMVPVAGAAQPMGHHTARRVIVEEEVIEDEAPAPHHGGRRVIHREPEGDKRIPLN